MSQAAHQVQAPDAHGGGAHEPERRFPPINEFAAASLGLTIVGGIYLASSIPRLPALGPAWGLLIASWAAMLASITLLVRLKDFAWYRFNGVALRALAAYVVEAGMLEYVFVYDHVRGSLLVVLTLMLVIFGTTVPLMIGFTSARYAAPVRPAD